MKKYQFYGWEQADVPATSKTYEKIKNPKELYDILSEIWCADTCAPRMRERWSKENQTLGQCSITAFLAQDIFGGKVYGILRPGGNYHCYNVVGDCCFDLTSEQFGDEILDYRENPEQFRGTFPERREKAEIRVSEKRTGNISRQGIGADETALQSIIKQRLPQRTLCGDSLQKYEHRLYGDQDVRLSVPRDKSKD